MARTFSALSSASPEAVWRLVAEPDRWPDWAPHVRGAWGLGSPEVERGRGAARLLGFVPVPATIVDKDAGRSWAWRVGPMRLDHTVEPVVGGSRVTMTLSAPGPIEPLLAATYGPVVRAMVERLARVAAFNSAPASSTSTSA